MAADRPADAAVTAPVSAPVVGRLRSVWARPPRWLPAALGVLLVALLVTSGVVGWQLRQVSAVQERRAAVLQAATDRAAAFLSLHYRHVGRDTAQVLAGATGAFRQQYAGSLGRLRALVTDNRTVSTGEVLSAGVVSLDADSARTIVVADSQVTNVSTPGPQPRHYRLQLDLALQDGRWLLSDLRFVG
jgi:Mce-associated membrane protein